MKLLNLGKYRVLVVSIALFLLLDAAVLVLNFYTSFQIERDAHAIQVTNRLRVLSQTVINQLYHVREKLLTSQSDVVAEDPQLDRAVERLGDSYKTLDETLDSLIWGGELIGKGQGRDSLFVNSEYSAATKDLLDGTDALWQAYRPFIQPVVYSWYTKPSREELLTRITAALDHGAQVNDKFLELLGGIARTTENIAQYKAVRLRRVQVTGISLAVLNFVFILFHFLRKLGESDRQTEKARKETEEILGTVKEGLFLLDADLRIGTQRSRSLGTLLNADSFADKGFLDILRPMVTEKTLAILKDYIEILFKPNVSESLIASLNPLDEIEVVVDNKDGTLTTKYLAFDFSRVFEKGRISHLLVTINDVTDQVNLRRQLEATEARTGREMEMLLSVLHVDRQLIPSFVTNFRGGLEDINRTLRSQVRQPAELKDKLREIARIAHRLKGDCSAVGLSHCEYKLHDFEDAVVTLESTDQLTGNDFLSVTVGLNNLIRDWEVLESIVSKLSVIDELVDSGALGDSARKLVTLTDAVDTAPEDMEKAQWERMLYKLADDVAAHFNKSVALNLQRFDPASIPARFKEAVKTFIIQSVRNSIAHGIETPRTRKAAGKADTGVIQIYAQRQGDQLYAGVRDDGAGLNLNEIRRQARARGLMRGNDKAPLGKKEVIDLLFSPGFSTAAVVSTHAGRGIGLDLVRATIEKAGGQIDVGSRPNAYTEFRATIPWLDDTVAAPATA